MSGRMVGVTVLPEFFQVEGVEAVLDNLQRRAGITTIATSPYVMAPAPAGQGEREPPGDAGAGKVRLLDRPLWGRRALDVVTAPGFAPDAALYEGLRYRPQPPDGLTSAHGEVVRAAVRSAKARGLAVHMQVQAAIAPGYRVQFGEPHADDQPALPDGMPLGRRIDNQGAIASPHVRAYARALVRDVARNYPEIDVIRLDWPEYPPYVFDSLFCDFSEHARAAAARLGFPFEAIRRDVAAARAAIATPAFATMLRDVAAGGNAGAIDGLVDRYPGLLQLSLLKAAIVGEFWSDITAALREESAGRIALAPQVFPPPWNMVSGADYAHMAPDAPMIGVKLYTMHWPVIARNYADAILRLAPHLAGEPALMPAILDFLDIVDDPAARPDVAAWRYPEPDEAHPVSADAQARKIAFARDEAAGKPVVAFAHGYGPFADVEARLAVAWRASGGRLFVNRYGYLSDAKLDAIGRVTAATTRPA